MKNLLIFLISHFPAQDKALINRESMIAVHRVNDFSVAG
jgi:hypothetical protein